MCGIAGIAGRRDPEAVGRMIDAIAHRGPDDGAVWADDAATLGHRRLSIIDLAGGAQPMAYADGACQIVYNGEVYNFEVLRGELAAKGHAFRTRCDTEVILAAYAEWGEACVEKLRGMFAFALWDARERKLVVARDPVGVKPFYYAEHNGCFYFGSEIKALLACPEIPRDMDPEGLDDFFAYLYTVPPRTMFQAVRQLPPATAGVWKDGRFTTRRYWRLEFAQENRPADDWAAEIDAHLAATVRDYMVSDVPLGAFLSGGLDSATIVHHMAQTGATPETFTVGFGAEGNRYDESAYARDIARHFNTNHHEITATADVLELLPTLVRHFDEPFGNPSAVLFYVLCQRIREHVTVVLSGDGGDESFGGYPRHVGARLAGHYRSVPHALRRWLVNPLVQLLPENTRGFHALRRLREFSAGSLLPPVDMYAAWIGYFNAAERHALYGPDLRRNLEGRDPMDYLRGVFNECAGHDIVSQVLYVDLMTFLPHNLLQCSDRMSMAHGLESRVPLADQALIEQAARVPANLKVRGMETKHILRRCMAGKLPPDTVGRKKMGFNPPLGVWLTGALEPLVDDWLSPAAIERAGLFDPAPIQLMLADHRASRRDYTWHLWALLLFEQWRRDYLA
ncbi:MAG: asparagine synthase (glutamine-hydrolyzing) [Candidatus Hydrogenedentota bacterium]